MKEKRRIVLGMWREKEWQSREWKKEKRELRKVLRRLSKGKIDREEYIRKRKEYKIWCQKERKRYEKMEEEKISRIKTRKKRKKRKYEDIQNQ